MNAETTMERVLVVIPTLNEARSIESVLEVLFKGTDAEGVTFVVADGGSTDSTRQIVQNLAKTRSNLILIDNPYRYQAAAINLAAWRFGGESGVLIRCDAHAVYPKSYVNHLVKSLLDNRADSIVVPMDSRGTGPVQKVIAWVSDTPVGSGGAAHRGGRRSGFVDHGHHAAFKLKTFKELGGYDETFTHNEDAEYDVRQRLIGGTIFLDSKIRLCYQPRKGLGELFNQYYNYGKGRAKTVRKHPSSIKVRQFAVIANFAALITSMVASYYVVSAMAYSVVYGSILLGTSIAGAYRLGLPYGILAGPVAFVMHSAWSLGFLKSLVFNPQPRWNLRSSLPNSVKEMRESSCK